MLKLQLASAEQSLEGYESHVEVLKRENGALVELLLDQPWHKKCDIVPNYMPPFPSKDTRPTMQVRYNDGTEYPPFLRYSQGPKQGFFWDIYGDDMQTKALAILALSKAPAPANVGPITIKIALDAAKEQG